MKVQDIAAIKAFNTKQHLYLKISKHDHLKIKRRNCFGRWLMSKKFNSSSFDKVIAYLEKNYSNGLVIDELLKTKVLDKICSRESKRKYSCITSGLRSYLTVVPPPPPPPLDPDELDPPLKFWKIDKDSPLNTYKSILFSKVLLELIKLPYQTWLDKPHYFFSLAQSGTELDDKYFEDLNALIRERVKLLDAMVDFSRRVSNASQEIFVADLLLPWNAWNLRIKLLSASEMNGLTWSQMQTIATKSSSNWVAISTYLKNNDLKNALFIKELNELPDDELFVNPIIFITFLNDNKLAALNTKQFSKNDWEELDKFFLTSLVFKNPVHRFTPQQLQDCMVNMGRAIHLISDDQLPDLDYDLLTLEQFERLFLQFPFQLKKKFKYLSGSQINKILKYFDKDIIGVLSKKHIPDLDIKKLNQPMFDALFKTLKGEKRLELLTDPQKEDAKGFS